MGLAERENRRKSVISTITNDKKTETEENNGRIQRSYYIDADIVKALKIKAARESKKMTDVVNEILRTGLKDCL
nr:MAG TPA: SeqA protein N-terminal domain [Caudoviricetes sp.]